MTAAERFTHYTTAHMAATEWAAAAGSQFSGRVVVQVELLVAARPLQPFQFVAVAGRVAPEGPAPELDDNRQPIMADNGTCGTCGQVYLAHVLHACYLPDPDAGQEVPEAEAQRVRLHDVVLADLPSGRPLLYAEYARAARVCPSCRRRKGAVYHYVAGNRPGAMWHLWCRPWPWLKLVPERQHTITLRQAQPGQAVFFTVNGQQAGHNGQPEARQQAQEG